MSEAKERAETPKEETVGKSSGVGENKRKNAVNYDLLMREALADFSEEERDGKGRKRLLLHSCCAPCSTACLEILKEYCDVTVFYYNPNIDDEAEYEKRKSEQIRFLKRTGWAKFIDCDHDVRAFFEIAAGKEECPERGARCYECYKLRLFKTAERAKEEAFDCFASTLSVSPYKNAAWLNEIGFAAEKEYGTRYLPSDFKKRGGYYRSAALSKEYGLYRQSYCGCRYSKRDEDARNDKRGGESLETEMKKSDL